MSDDERLHDDDDQNKRWLEACQREEAIRALLKRHPDGRLTIKEVQDVAWEVGVSRATLYRLIASYRSQGTVNSVKPTRRGRREGTLVLDRRRDQLIAKTINEIYLTPTRPTLTYLVEQIHARFAAKSWPLPDRRTIKARVDRIDLRKRALKRKDDKAIKATKAVPGEYSASRPLEIVQIDHTQADIFLIDEITRRPMQDRPWLTLAIDVFTRMITGFHLSLDPPSRVSISLCMLHAVYDKTAWLQEREIEADWPVAGLPEKLHADNGKDSRSSAFVRACRNEGITPIWRIPAAPHYGGHIERLIGTMMGRVHFWPGSTFSNPAERGSIDPKPMSVMTFREFECVLGWEIAGRYNQEIHRTLLRPPIAVWREHETDTHFRMPKDRMAFWVSFLPEEHRKLRPDGIWLHGIPYWSNTLSSSVGRTDKHLLVKYDPRDVSRIFAQCPNGHFVEARTRNLAFPAISLHEWQIANTKKRQKGRGERNTDQLHKTALAQRKLVDGAIRKTAEARANPSSTLKSPGDNAGFGSLKGIDSRTPSLLEIAEKRLDRSAKPSDQ
jgi:putative transposase